MRDHSLFLTACAIGFLGCGEARQAPQVDPVSGVTEHQTAAAEPRYFIARDSRPGAEPLFRAQHPEMGLQSEFSRGKVLLRPAAMHASAPALNLRAAAWGCPQGLSTLAEVEPQSAKERPDHVSYEQPGGDFVEWYRHGAAGLEQGFTISKLPACAEARGSLVIEISRSVGWAGLVAADRTRATFRHDSGTTIHYSDAYARSALGGVHTVEIAPLDDAVALHVDLTDVVLPLVIDPLAWSEQQRVIASDGVNADSFGYAVAISAGVLAVGAPDNSEKASGAGAVYSYTRSSTAWGSQQKLMASDGAAGDHLGYSVASTATYLAAGAIGDDDGASDAGSVYVWTRSGNSWGNEKKIAPSDPEANAWFGFSVALDATTLLIGVSSDDDLGADAGSAYVYTFNGSNWIFQQKLLAVDAGADAGDGFGTSVALSGNTAIVGALNDSDVVNGGGSAYVFVRSGTTWTQQAKLHAGADSAPFDAAGQSVAISGNTVAIGAPGDSDQATSSGSAYVWTRSGTTWTQQGAKLTASDASDFANFGQAVALDLDNLVVGAKGDASNQGAAYVFTRNGSVWSPTPKLTATDGSANHYYGTAVALDDATVAVGAELANANKGAAYVASLTDSSTCATGNDCKSGYCVEGVCCNSACSNTCQSCLASRKTSGADGICGNIKVDTDPRNGCDVQAASTCGTTGVCNGSGACKVHGAGTECVAPACPSATSENPADQCNGSGSCVPTATVACQRGYLCKAGACLTSCDADNDCDATQSFECDLATNKCKVPQAGPCTANSDCGTAHCSDGVCCNDACTQKCNSCLASEKGSGVDGVCAAIAADTDPSDECAVGAQTCGADGWCDGEGACRSFAKPATPCGVAACNPSVSTKLDPDDSCDGAGNCVDSPEINCQRGYLCKAGACPTSCAASTDCDASLGFECLDNECKVPQAGACSADSDCATNHCSDGVCCDEACDQKCNSCLAADKGVGQDGVCGPLPADTDPADECAADADPCGADGSCDGEGSCRAFAKPQTACGPTECVADETSGTHTITGKLCDGEGNCADDSTSCAPYKCSGTACGQDCQTDEECHGAVAPDVYVGAFCNAAFNTCQDKRPDGIECARQEDCASGHCVDGYCCNVACTGQCEACGETGAEGKCVAVSGEPRGGRPACEDAPADEPCLDVSCNGKSTDRDTCAGYVGSTVECQAPKCEDGEATGVGLCDGAGNCSVAAPTSCGTYKCGAEECLTECQNDQDCVEGNRCTDGKCGSGARCSDDLTSVVDADGNGTSCAPFLCEGEACLTACTTSTDCAGSFVCNLDNQQCEPIATTTAEDAGCGCRTVGRDPRGSLVAIIGVSLLLLRRRRSAASRELQKT